MHPSHPDPAYTGRGPAPDTAGGEDAALVRRIGACDETALSALYDRWVQPLYSAVMHLLQDADDAEDIVEETFWQVWQRARSYDPARGSVRTWLLTIARSRALDRLRARGRRPDAATDVSTAELLAAPADDDPAASAEGGERARRVGAALAELPADQRRALELAYFGGLTQVEIAQALGEPLGTVKTRMRLGLRKLRDALGILREDAPALATPIPTDRETTA